MPRTIFSSERGGSSKALCELTIKKSHLILSRALKPIPTHFGHAAAFTRDTKLHNTNPKASFDKCLVLPEHNESPLWPLFLEFSVLIVSVPRCLGYKSKDDIFN